MNFAEPTLSDLDMRLKNEAPRHQKSKTVIRPFPKPQRSEQKQKKKKNKGCTKRSYARPVRRPGCESQPETVNEGRNHSTIGLLFSLQPCPATVMDVPNGEAGLLGDNACMA